MYIDWASMKNWDEEKKCMWYNLRLHAWNTYDFMTEMEWELQWNIKRQKDDGRRQHLASDGYEG